MLLAHYAVRAASSCKPPLRIPHRMLPSALYPFPHLRRFSNTPTLLNVSTSTTKQGEPLTVKPVAKQETENNVPSMRANIMSFFSLGPKDKSEDSAMRAASFRKILALAKPERRPLTIAIGLLLVSSTVSMSIPLTIGKLVDYFSTSDTQILFGLSATQAGIALFALFSIGAAANAARSILMRLSGQRIIARLRSDTYASALRQDVEYVERTKGEGDVLSRLGTDAAIVGESITQNLSDGLRSVVMASVGLGAMFWISPTLTGLMLALVPPTSLGVFFYGRYLKRLSNRTQQALGDMTKVATESLSALRTVQSYNANAMENSKFSDRVDQILTLARKEAWASGIFFGSTGWAGNVTILTLLGYGGTQVAKGIISVGDLTSLLLYTVYVGGGLQMLTSFFTSIMRGIGAGSRIFDLMSREPAISLDKGVELDPQRRGPITFENITFEYPSRKDITILRNFDLNINIGESVALVGRSGSGKSSVHSLLLRFYDPSNGVIKFDGQDIREFTPTSWRSIIGVVPQDPVLFTGTIASNITYGVPHATGSEIEAAARQASCDFIWDMPDQFETKIDRLSLSGGQRQRLAIARALLKKPAILTLDEATSSLDATSEQRVNEAVDKILESRATTCFIVAHRLSTIARAERIVVLEDGRITETGTYRKLVMTENSRFRALMAAQLDAAAGESAIWSAATKPPVHEKSVTSN